ncbi:hypothetical protein [Pseudoalteromonas distincta]|uniref:hypothetical protein n=1 Tax=Pseudoalteromonas distincta TaxID=77608 RepID=UPI0034E88FC0
MRVTFFIIILLYTNGVFAQNKSQLLPEKYILENSEINLTKELINVNNRTSLDDLLICDVYTGLPTECLEREDNLNFSFLLDLKAEKVYRIKQNNGSFKLKKAKNINNVFGHLVIKYLLRNVRTSHNVASMPTIAATAAHDFDKDYCSSS